MAETCAALLTAVYGSAVASSLDARLAELLARWRPRLAGVRHAQAAPLTERDVLLITYADQLREPGRAPLEVLGDFAARHWAGVITGIHLLPFYPWSSDDGFSVKDYYAVDPASGRWEDIARLGRQFDLMFDGVFNHLSAQGDWFRRFLAGDPDYRDFFVTVEGSPDLARVVRPRTLPLLTEFPSAAGPRKVWTTFSADQADLNFRNPEVLLRIVDALLFYVSQGARYIRLDAIAFLWKEIGTPCLHLPQTHQVIRLLRAVLEAVAPGVRLITETNVPHADNVSYFGDGTNEAQLVYNFALPPLLLHAFATGNAERLTRWARSLTLPSDEVTFFNFLASHDGIGLNPVRGILDDAAIEALVARSRSQGGFISCKRLPDGAEAPYEMNLNYLEALSPPGAGESADLAARRLLTSHAILFSLRGVPGIYFHSWVGSRGDRAGAEASGIPRRINRQKLDRVLLESELGDPGSLRAKVVAGNLALLSARQRHPAFAPNAPQDVRAIDPRVFALVRRSRDGSDAILCLHNLSGERVPVNEDQGGTRGLRWGHPLWGVDPDRVRSGTLGLEPWSSAWIAVRESPATRTVS